jgi:hypothetical protein
MKYKKGEFTTVPNTRSLSKLSATAQALFLWVCIYADDDGQCYPSRAILAQNLNCAVRTIDQYLKELCDFGFIEKNHRFYGNEKTTNLYQIVLVVGQKTALPSAENSTTPSAESAHRTKSILTKPILSEQSSQKYEIVPDVEEKPRKVKSTEALEVFAIFGEVTGKNPLNWRTNKTQRQSAENLFQERGLEQVRQALEFHRETKDEHFCPTIHTPYDLDSKWSKLFEFKKKHYGD